MCNALCTPQLCEGGVAEWLRPEDWEGSIQSPSSIFLLCVNSSRAVGSLLSVPSDYTTLAKLSTVLTNARNQLGGKIDSRAVGFLPREKGPESFMGGVFNDPE